MLQEVLLRMQPVVPKQVPKLSIISLLTSDIPLLTSWSHSMCFLQNQLSISGVLGGILTPTSLSMLAVLRGL